MRKSGDRYRNGCGLGEQLTNPDLDLITINIEHFVENHNLDIGKFPRSTTDRLLQQLKAIRCKYQSSALPNFILWIPMNKAYNIKLADYFAEKVNSRSSVNMVFDQVTDQDPVVLDFSQIGFISRAAAHELITLMDKLQSEGKSISLKEVRPSVDKMIKSVSESRSDDFKSHLCRKAYI